MASKVIAEVSIPGDEGFPLYEVWLEERGTKRSVILTDVLLQQHTYIPPEYAMAVATAIGMMAGMVETPDV